MVWFKLLICVAIILFAGSRLAYYGDAIAEKTRLGRLWIGLVLISAVTTMPELVTSVSSVTLVGLPDLAMGNLLGSCLFNLAILAIVDLLLSRKAVLSQASRRHALSAALGIVLLAITALGVVLAWHWGLALAVGWIGALSIVVWFVYLGGARLVFVRERKACEEPEAALAGNYEAISTRTACVRCAVASMAIIGAGIWLSLLGEEIAQATGWNTSFVGNMFLAITTSLPELVVVAAAVRLGAVDLAVANILGANMLNMLTVTWADVALTDGPILSLVSSSHAVTASAAIGMSLVVIIAVYRGRGRRGFLAARWYVPLIVGLYLFGSYASFTQMCS